MRKRESLVPIAVLLAVMLTLLLACSRLTSVPGAPSPTARPPGMPNLSDYWPGWEKASWAATVISMPIAAIALAIAAGEQIRISRELRRRPRIAFGFKSCRRADWSVAIWSTETEVEAAFGEGADISDAVPIRIIAANLGNGVATNVVWNYDFHDGAKIVQETIYGRRYMIEDGYERVIPMAATLNPHGVTSTTIKIRVPRATPRLRVEVVAYCAEVRGVRESLSLSVTEKFKINDPDEHLPEWP